MLIAGEPSGDLLGAEQPGFQQPFCSDASVATIAPQINVLIPTCHLLFSSKAKKKHSLKQYLLEKMKSWINSLLEGERDEFLGRGRHGPLDPEHDNYRNGYRRRKINFFGLGEIELKVPRDRQGEFESKWLPQRRGQDATPRPMPAAECAKRNARCFPGT